MNGQIALFGVLLKKEIKEVFYSPMVHVLAAIFSLVMGWLFFNYLVAAGALSASVARNQVLVPLFGNMNFVFLFLAPLISMGLFSQESKQHTLGTLMGSSLSPLSIVLAKWAAGVIAAGYLLLPTLVLPGILAFGGFNEWGVLASAYGGILASIACYMAVGVFTSTLTDNQMVAAVSSFGILLGIMLLVFSASASENGMIGQIFSYMSVPFHFENSVRGAVKSFDLVYYLSFIGLFTLASLHSLKVRVQ